jgi:hypothetical protein
MYNKFSAIWYQTLKEKTSKLWVNFFFGGQVEIMSLWWWWWVVWWWTLQHDASVAMLIEKIIDLTPC